MSKITKLVRSPRRFFLDSKAYRRVLLTQRRILDRTSAQPQRPAAWLDVDEDWAAELLRDVAVAVPVLDVSHPPELKVGFLREDLYYATEYLHRVAQHPDLIVTATFRGGSLDLKSSRLFELDDHLSRAESFTIVFEQVSRPRRVVVRFEIWNMVENQAVAPTSNPFARRISQDTIEAHGLFRRGPLEHARSLHPCGVIDQVEFPIDIVYTWVNHRDARWRALYQQAVGAPPETETNDTKSLDRFMNRDELKYSMRSISAFAPWVRTIYVVTNCSPPAWLNVDHPKVVWVDHSEIIPTHSLPTFSSHAIESRLHHVPNLADHFLYFNDDFFLTRPTRPTDFFFANGLSKSALEGYGSVNGTVSVTDPDYLNAARNGKALIEREYGRSPTALHKHTPYALRRDVLLEMEHKFKAPISDTTARAFRSIGDISTVSFLYHHYAFITGRAVFTRRDAWLIKPRTSGYERRLLQLLAGRKAPVSLCLNDGGGSVGYSHWDQHVVEFLEAFLPDPSPFETTAAREATNSVGSA